MADKVLMKGNEALSEAAIRAGCRFFAGYPITPQNEIPEYMSKRMLQVGGTFIQAESEIAAINMVYGAAGAGARAMTSSSSPGISLKQEGISYIAGAELPCVIVNVNRGGPGLGGLPPAQGDYFQATKGGGHGDYRLLVLAPSTVQELFDLGYLAFELADKYRNPVMILSDTVLGQMMEPLVLSDEVVDPKDAASRKPWATTGCAGRKPNIINSLALQPEKLEKMNLGLQEKYLMMQRDEVRFEEQDVEGAEIVVTAYGTPARIAKMAVATVKKRGVKVGYLRPITLFPFPSTAFADACKSAKAFLSVELNSGQMVEDVRLAVCGRAPVHFHGRLGGMVPTVDEVAEVIMSIAEGRI